MGLAEKGGVKVIAQGYGIELQCVVLLHKAGSGTGGNIPVPYIFHCCNISGLLPSVKKNPPIYVLSGQIDVFHIIHQCAVVGISAEAVKEGLKQ